LKRKASALEQQILEERRRIADHKDGLAARIATYERLQLECEFARRTLSQSEIELVRARTEAAHQLLYLEHVVEPHLADYPTQPKRLRLVMTVLAGNLLLLLVGWLLVSGMSEHAPRLR
jgi:capsular polysaccharide transport system permease protein